jgi:hypothetical protein
MNYIDTIKMVNNESKFEVLINGNLNVECAGMIYKNFSGKPTKVNPAGGKRTFSLVLTKELAERLSDMGWNIKVKEVRDQQVEGEISRTVSWEDFITSYQNEFDHALIYTEIVVNENSEYPPKIYKVSEFNGEKSIALVPPDQWYRLDESDLLNIDLVIHPYTHGRSIANPNAKKGYLKTMYATAQPVNAIDGKYAGYMIAGEN